MLVNFVSRSSSMLVEKNGKVLCLCRKCDKCPVTCSADRLAQSSTLCISN